MRLLLLLPILLLVGCATTKPIDSNDLTDYLPYVASENKTSIDGKYIECVLEDTISTFHIGNGKISGIASSWGNAEAGNTNYARWWSVDLINEDEEWLTIGYSNRAYAKYCGAPLIALEESVFKIRRFDGWVSETKYFANDRTYGSNRDGLLTQRKFEEGECKLFKTEKKYGACKFFDVDPDVKIFLEPYMPKGL